MSLNTNYTMVYDVENSGHGLGQAQTNVAGLNRLVRCQRDLLIIGSLTAI
jgi:hypothetical protein